MRLWHGKRFAFDMGFECLEKVQVEIGAVGLNGSMAEGFANKEGHSYVPCLTRK
ncbi:hypothetical protein ANABIO32_06470 [Rossellomorea marisflavi]|nr:hypothetical protein ANABIO32_06470 [Rossellomorea marisflavi]